MNDKNERSTYAKYIAEALQEAQRVTGINLPEGTVLVAKSYSPLAAYDEIIGMKIFVMDMPSSYEFFIAFPSANEKYYPLQKAFCEALDIIPEIEEEE
jgi:hypothetical protein